MIALPSGTVTFLFTDIEGSTRRWEQDPAEMSALLERHNTLLRVAIERGHGQVFRMAGDAICAVFATAPAAVASAAAAQRGLAAESWGAGEPLRVRMALHAGAAVWRDGDYDSACLNRLSRLLMAAHGRQTLLSASVRDLVGDALPQGVGLRDLGEHRFKDLQRPEHVYQLVDPALQAEFPPLQTLDARPNNLPVQRTLL